MPVNDPLVRPPPPPRREPPPPKPDPALPLIPFRWDPEALRDELVRAVDVAEAFYLTEDRHLGTSLANTAVSTVAELARGSTSVLELGTNSAKAAEHWEKGEDAWDYALAVAYLAVDAGEAAGVVLGAVVAAGRLKPGVAAKLGEVPGSARAVANANLRSLGLENVNLKGASFNSGAKQLEKAGFRRLANTETGRREFVHPKTGTKVAYDGAPPALTKCQEPHWHIQSSNGHRLSADGRVVEMGEPRAHVRAR